VTAGGALRILAVAALGAALTTSDSSPQDERAGGIRADLVGVRAYLESAEREAGFSGVVLIGRGDDVVFQEAYGFAEADLGVRMRTDHRLRIGSLTKPVTASAVLVAVERGLFPLDVRIADLLSSCPESWSRVTVRHLLTHTSGIPDHFGDLEAVPVQATAEELRRVLDGLSPGEPLASEPGSEYAYSNFNYVLVGAALEQAMGVPWEAALQELVFEPLGLRTMAYDDVYAVVPGRVRGYERDEELGLRNIDHDDHAAYAAGGLLASAGDVFRWSRGMLTGKLFDPRLVRESLTPYRDDYGYGWQVRRFFDRVIYNHTGEIDGFSSHLAYYPAEELTIVVLSNVENDSAILRACDLACVLFNCRPAVDPRESGLTPGQRCGLAP